MDFLKDLPDRGTFRVIEGIRMPDGPAYICCHDTSPTADRLITNGTQQLHDLYKKSQQHQSAIAAKRQAKPHLDDRANKRQHTATAPATGAAGHHGAGLEAALAAVAGSRPSNAPTGPVMRKASGQPPLDTAAAVQNARAENIAHKAAGSGFAVPNTAVLNQGAAAAATAGPIQPPQNGGSNSRQTVFSMDELKGKTNKELVELLRARSCPVSGSKTELIKRLLDYQRRLKKAQG